MLGLVLALIIYFLVPGEQYPKAPLMAAIVVLMAVWWVLEVVPIAITSLIPIICFPLFGIGSLEDVTPLYFKSILLLFLGGFLLAMGLQKSGIHKRIALKVVLIVGTTPRRLVLGFMVATGFLSMWIANTASVLVMLPIALSIMDGVKQNTRDDKLIKAFGISLMLGIAYAADIGGMATLIGTPPNMIFVEMYGQLFPDAAEIGFMEWFIICSPLSVIFIYTGWLMLTRFIHKLPKENIYEDKKQVEMKLKQLGPLKRDEKVTGIIFLSAALLWMTGSDINISEDFVIHGWRYWLNLPEITDPIVAIGTAFLLFLVPSKQKKGKAILSYKDVRIIPWSILLLFGGGFAIAGGFELTGLDHLIEQVFEHFPVMSPLLILGIIALFVTFFTELTSNTAVTNLILPILATAAIVMHIDPKLLMIPATLSASCAFMMPIASPTQAIVYGSGYVSIKEMMKTGVWFNLLGVILILILFSFISQFFWT
ncbi:MAG: SLC13 family permease [Crocinitomicaceae bacterium]